MWEKQAFFILKTSIFDFWSKPIFTAQNLPPNRPILIKTISFHRNKHCFHLENKVFQVLNFLSKPKGGPHDMHTVVPPLVHVKIFTAQNLPPNHPILIETISFH